MTFDRHYLPINIKVKSIELECQVKKRFGQIYKLEGSSFNMLITKMS